MKNKRITIIILGAVFLLAIVIGYLRQSWFLAPGPGPVEKITIGTSTSNVTGLLLVAREKGFLANNGLKVTLKFFQSGNQGLEQLKAGKIDFACFTESVLVSGIFAGNESLKCLGAMAAALDIQVIARKDQGILRPADLKGKRIGIFRGSNAEFFLGRFLAFNSLYIRDVKLVNLKPFAMAQALRGGRVDAVIVWEPAAHESKRMGGDKTVSWPGQGGQPYFWLLVSTDRFIKTRPGVVDRLFRGLAQAEEYLKRNRQESIDIVAAQVKLNPTTLKNVWSKYSYELSIDQSLLIAMEDQARWMINKRLTDKKLVPDYLHYIITSPMAKVDPQAVRLIIPQGRK